MTGTARWYEVVAGAPALAGAVRERFESGRHKTLATVRRDGAPRISGTETAFTDEDVTLGMMSGSVKLADVDGDPRVALHSPSCDPDPDDESAWPGEAKLAGTLQRTATDDDGASHFRLAITEVVLTRIGEPADHLVVESWHPGRGYTRRRRE